jgi:hypothetical protein
MGTMGEQRRPSPPTPEDFQITVSDISHFEAQKKRLEDLAPKLCFSIAATVLALCGLIETDWKWMFSDGFAAPSTYVALVMMLVGLLFFSMVASLPVAFFVFPLTSFAINRIPKADAVRRYTDAVVAFRIWLDRSRRDWWLRLSGLKFEIELARLLRALGWEATPTRASGDGGIDIVGQRDGVKFIVQCKNHKSPVGPAVVRELYGALLASDASHAILASTSGFTKGVHEFVNGKPIELISLDWIIRQHMDHDASWKSLMNPVQRQSRVQVGLRRRI